MGGAQGKIQHLFEDYSLKISEVLDIFQQLVVPSEPDFLVFEKFDGINMMFTILPDGNVSFARSKNDINAGGVSKVDICKRFKEENLSKIVLSALESWEENCKKYKTTQTIFCDGTWGSFEIIQTQYPNVIKYDENAIIVHPIMVKNGATLLQRHKNYIDVDRKIGDWKISGPKFTGTLGIAGAKFHATSLIMTIKKLLISKKDPTLSDIYRTTIAYDLYDQGFSLENAYKISDRILKLDGYLDVKKIKKTLSASECALIGKVIKDERKYVKFSRRKIEDIVDRISTIAVSNLKSSLIKDHKRHSIVLTNQFLDWIEKNRIAPVSQETIRKISLTNGFEIQSEGVVFWYPKKQKFYKMTGLFRYIQHAVGYDSKEYVIDAEVG